MFSGEIDWIFWACLLVSVPAALMVVLERSPVRSALGLLVCFLAFAVVYLQLHAPFLAAIHVLVYTGAILVLFLFVIMLLNLRNDELGTESPRLWKAGVGLMCVAFAGSVSVLLATSRKLSSDLAPRPEDWGDVRGVGRMLFGGYLVHFELVGLLLTVAMIGAMVLAKRKP